MLMAEVGARPCSGEVGTETAEGRKERPFRYLVYHGAACPASALGHAEVLVKLCWPSGAVRGLRSFIIADSYYIIMSIYVTYDISRPDGRGAYVAGAVRY